MTGNLAVDELAPTSELCLSQFPCGTILHSKLSFLFLRPVNINFVLCIQGKIIGFFFFNSCIDDPSRSKFWTKLRRWFITDDILNLLQDAMLACVRRECNSRRFRNYVAPYVFSGMEDRVLEISEFFLWQSLTKLVSIWGLGDSEMSRIGLFNNVFGIWWQRYDLDAGWDIQHFASSLSAWLGSGLIQQHPRRTSRVFSFKFWMTYVPGTFIWGYRFFWDTDLRRMIFIGDDRDRTGKSKSKSIQLLKKRFKRYELDVLVCCCDCGTYVVLVLLCG